MNAAELLELDAARELGSAEALSVVAVAGGAAQAGGREGASPGLRRRHALRQRNLELGGAAGGLSELPSRVDANPVVVGHPAAEVALGEDGGERDQAAGHE